MTSRITEVNSAPETGKGAPVVLTWCCFAAEKNKCVVLGQTHHSRHNFLLCVPAPSLSLLLLNGTHEEDWEARSAIFRANLPSLFLTSAVCKLVNRKGQEEKPELFTKEPRRFILANLAVTKTKSSTYSVTPKVWAQCWPAEGRWGEDSSGTSNHSPSLGLPERHHCPVQPCDRPGSPQQSPPPTGLLTFSLLLEGQEQPRVQDIFLWLPAVVSVKAKNRAS